MLQTYLYLSESRSPESFASHSQTAPERPLAPQEGGPIQRQTVQLSSVLRTGSKYSTSPEPCTITLGLAAKHIRERPWSPPLFSLPPPSLQERKQMLRWQTLWRLRWQAHTGSIRKDKLWHMHWIHMALNHWLRVTFYSSHNPYPLGSFCAAFSFP